MPVIDYFQDALNFIWLPTNDGQSYHASAHDPGSATAWGVTYATWTAWQKMHNASTTLAIFAAMKQSDFVALYRTQYWNSTRCGVMGAPGIQIFDIAVNCGPGHAASFLQHVLGIPNTSQVDPATLQAYAKADPAVVTRALCTQREEYYAQCPNACYFERGWDNRAEACRDYVLSLMDQAPPGVVPTPAPVVVTSTTVVVATTTDDLNAQELNSISDG
jgi:lysozyme family protein